MGAGFNQTALFHDKDLVSITNRRQAMGDHYNRFILNQLFKGFLLFCLDSVAAALEKMTENIIKKYGRLPLVFAGGVMSNSIIRRRFTEEFGAYFAEPAFSADNAAGTAYLTYLRERKNA